MNNPTISEVTRNVCYGRGTVAESVIVVECMECAKELVEIVLGVGSILPDDKPGKRSIIYGHPTSEKWFEIFMKAREFKQRAAGK